MLDLTRLDDRSYRALLEEAFAELPLLAPDWTDYNAHDPGITFLEYIAWLTEMQRYYLQQITNRHRLQYLKLLGCLPAPARPARLLVTVQAAEGDLLLHGGARASVGGIPYLLPQDALLHAAELRVCREADGEGLDPDGFLPFGKAPRAGDCFYLRLSPGLSPGRAYHLYVHLSRQEGRVPMEAGYSAQAELLAEAWDGAVWRPFPIADETYGFAQSGFIVMEPPEGPAPPEGFPLLRLSLARCDLEEPPMLLWLSLQTALFLQQDAPYPAETALPVAADRTVALRLDGASVSKLSLSVLEEDGEYHVWERTHNLFCLTAADRGFELDEDGACLRFGDGRHGKSAGKLVKLHTLLVTRGRAGQVKENLRFSVEDDGVCHPAFNPFPAYGGADRERVDDAVARCGPADAEVERAVTREDYISLVLKTPGLCARSVQVFTREPGKVCVCVKTHSGRLTEQARRNVRTALDKARLCCSELEIREPVRWDARLYASIQLETWADGKAEDLRRQVEALYRPLEDQFGLTIALSAWRSALLRIPYVSKVTELRLQGPDGEIARPDRTVELPPDTLLRVTECVLSIV